LLDRLEVSSGSKTSICILDAGINYDNPLLKEFSGQEYSEQWVDEWSEYETYHLTKSDYLYHGSLQAGIAGYGDLMDALTSDREVSIRYKLESARILPPRGDNPPELYGRVTTDTALKHEIRRPDFNRVYSLGITSDHKDIGIVGGQPSSWSSALDVFAFGAMENSPRLIIVSAGNNRSQAADLDVWDLVELEKIEDPAQSWNALTIGAYTQLVEPQDDDLDGWTPISVEGQVSPFSTSSSIWEWSKQAPLKPDIVFEGGNKLRSPQRTEVTNADGVSLLTTSGRSETRLYGITNGTSAACALASKMAAELMVEYPDYWPETVRGLMVHSASWTDAMKSRYSELRETHSPGRAKESLLRSVGYGVPNLDRARYSAENALTLIAQKTIKPFAQSAPGREPVFNEMHLYELPWPTEVLQDLPPETTVKVRVTLSYFIEPNPSRRGFANRYSYQSHALRFDMKRPGESLRNFRSAINQAIRKEEYDLSEESIDKYPGRKGDGSGWFLGPSLRTKGTLHQDIWVGSAIELTDCDHIAVFPITGWWKYKTSQERWLNEVRYSLIVSIETEHEEAQIYTAVENLIQTEVEV